MSSERSRPLPLMTPTSLRYKQGRWDDIPAPVWSENPYEDPRDLLKSVGYVKASKFGSFEIGTVIYWGDMGATKRQADKDILSAYPYVIIFEFAHRAANKVVYVASFPDLLALIGVDVFTTGRPSVDRRRPSRLASEDAEDEK
jgi:hypothetical protein